MERGSIAGGTKRKQEAFKSAGWNDSIVNTTASYSSTNGRTNSQVGGLGLELSIWQRQIHLL